MRLGLLAATSVLLAGCSAGGPAGPTGSPPTPPPSPVSSPAAPASPTPTATDPETAAIDACGLLSDSELQLLFDNKQVLSRKAFPAGQATTCLWVAAGGTVRLESMPASLWAGALPQLVAAIDESGEFAGTDTLARLHRAADQIAGGEHVSPEEACQLFSILFELRGEPAGSRTVITTGEPGTVTGFTCSDRRFTALTLTRRADSTLPLNDAEHSLLAAHHRSVG